MDPQTLPYVVAGAVVALTVVLLFVFNKSSKPFLSDPSRPKKQVPLLERIQLSHDTLLLRFGLESKSQKMGLPVGKHFKVFAPNVTGVKAGEWNGRPDPEAKESEIERKYTPTSSDDDTGHVDLVIKVYEGGKLSQFPDGGKMSQYMNSLKVGDMVTVNGPWGLIEYKGKGLFMNNKKALQKKRVGLMAGGTGITPMLQLISAILKDPNDTTEISLIFANKTEDDILVRDMLEALSKQHADRFKLWYTLDNPPKQWPYSKGFITADMIQAHLPPPGPDTLILMCGPPPMVKFACKDNLLKLNYAKPDMLEF